MQRIRAIIFDLDNTLIDFMQMKEEACKSAVKAMIAVGLDMNENEVGFNDFCYEGEINNKKDPCAGPTCRLNEIYCDAEGSYIKSEKVECKHGCSKGACIPETQSGEDCIKFNSDLWKWENIC